MLARVSCSSAIVIALAAATATAQPPPKPPELQVLDRTAGTWDFVLTAKKAEWTPNENKSTGTSVNEWVLDGRFMEHRTKFDKSESVMMMTYDANKKAFRQWAYDSQGYANEATGQWDEKTQTLTFTGNLNENVTAVTTMRFVDKDTREATMVAKDKSGKVYLDIHAKITRKK
jgi:phage terminase large subunit-like protein